jgi:hypothetical protein
MQLIALVPLVLLLPLDAREHMHEGGLGDATLPGADEFASWSQDSTPTRRHSHSTARGPHRSHERLVSPGSYQLPAYVPPSSGAVAIGGACLVLVFSMIAFVVTASGLS